MNKKGVVLIIAIMVMAVFLVLIGVYFSSLLTEKKSADSEEFILQALGLVEAGVNHGQAELRERIRTDLLARVQNERQAITFRNYVTGQNSLGFLRDFAYAAGDIQFTVAAGQATLAIAPLNLNSAVQGNYNANIIVTANGNPTNPQAEVFIFPYNYRIEAQGTITRTAPNTTKRARLVQGAFSITVRRDTFAKYALFTNHHRMPNDTTVWFTANTNFTGPVHTNERFSFANNPSGHFTEEVTQHQNTARFYNNGWPVLLDADANGTRDVPIFDQGFHRGEDIINLESSISQSELKRQALGGTSEPGSNGIYVPNDGTNVTGGIYIRGNQGNHNDDACINMSAPVDNPGGPVYTIQRGTGTPTTVTVDYTANEGNGSTIVQTGEVSNTYVGIPNGINDEGIIIYANDDVSCLAGTVQRDSNVTVSSERDIVVTNHVRYQEYNPSPLSAEGYTNVLGILSWGGNVRIGTTAPNNIEIHGVVMAPHGIFTVDNYYMGSPRGVATLLGGAITDFYGPFGTFGGTTNISGYGRNFVYDARMLQGTAPPYFPFMTNFTAFDDGGLNNKLIWQDQGN